MLKEMLQEIRNIIEEKEECAITATFMCDTIHLKNIHSMDIEKVEETENEIILHTTESVSFSFGLNTISEDFNEYENEYTFVYDNGFTIIITIL